MRFYGVSLFSALLLTGCAHMLVDGYPFDRSKSGCVRGDCRGGFGTYVYPDDDIYEGYWRDGLRHGAGRYFFVDQGSWAAAAWFSGTWVDGREHGKFIYHYPGGGVDYLNYYHGENVTERVRKCRDRVTLSEAYKGFVAIVNGLVAKSRGESALEGAARGYNAASRQAIPLAVDLTCRQLLAEVD